MGTNFYLRNREGKHLGKRSSLRGGKMIFDYDIHPETVVAYPAAEQVVQEDGVVMSMQQFRDTILASCAEFSTDYLGRDFC